MTPETSSTPTAVIKNLSGEITGIVYPIKGVSHGYPLWSQRDLRWANDRLGTSQWNLGQRGCLVTAIAIGLTAALDTEISPGHLNALLTANNGYVGGGNLAFEAIARLYPPIKFIERVIFRYKPAPAADIAKWANEGQIVVVQVDMDLTDPDVDQHWLIVTGGTEDIMNIQDPWPRPVYQKRFELPPAYCKQDWDPARAIYAYARYGVPKG